MNHVFRIIWSQAQRAWIVVSELARRRGKSSRGVDGRIAVVQVMPSAVRCGLRMSMLAAFLALGAPAWADDRWWDPNNTTLGLGGTGTWNTSGTFWSPNNDGVSGPYSAWNNAALDDAFFGGTAGTVTLGASITAHHLNFLANGYTITGSTLTLGGVDPTIAIGGTNITTTINSVIAGTAGLTLTGVNQTSLLTLNGVNTFSGDVNVNGGRLIVNGDPALGNVANMINMAAGARLDAGNTGGDLANRTVNLA